MTTFKDAQELTEFNIVDKPMEAAFTRRNGFNYKIAIALKNLSRDKAIEMAETAVSNVKALKLSLNWYGKKMGFKAGILVKHGTIYIFTKA